MNEEGPGRIARSVELLLRFWPITLTVLGVAASLVVVQYRVQWEFPRRIEAAENDSKQVPVILNRIKSLEDKVDDQIAASARKEAEFRRYRKQDQKSDKALEKKLDRALGGMSEDERQPDDSE